MEEPEPEPSLAPLATATGTIDDVESGITNDESPTNRVRLPSTTRPRRIARGSLLGAAWLFAAHILLMNRQRLEDGISEAKKAAYSDAQFAFYILWIFAVFLIVVFFYDYLLYQGVNIFLSFVACIAVAIFIFKADFTNLIPVLPLICDISLLGPVTPTLIRHTLPAILNHISTLPCFGAQEQPP